VKVFFTIVASICCFFSVFAQQGKEAKVGLQSNPVLQQSSQNIKVETKRTLAKSFNKAPSDNLLFPFTEWFEQDDSLLFPDFLLWNSSSANVKVESEVVIFNAQDSGNITYSNDDGSLGLADVLLSNAIDISGSNGQMFITFTYSTGSTWQPNNSLSLELQLPGASFLNVWNDGSVIADKKKVMIPINLSGIGSGTFSFRFNCTTGRTNTNTSTFLLHDVVVSDKLSVPFYENFVVANISNPSAPSNVNWQHAQPTIYNDNTINGISSVAFDAFDWKGEPYGNNGYADTLLSQPFDLSSMPVSDSVYIRFLYKKYPAASSTDTLLLDLLDSSNTWINIGTIPASQATTDYKTFMWQMNLPIFRHANFQFRFINKCDYTLTDTLLFGITGVHIGKKIQLPLVDDFSNDKLYPNSVRWKEKQVYINNDFAVAAPSVNVATFDGLDQRGNAYGQGNGYLDSLTCWPLNLLGLTKADSVYLSFYFEPQGLGEAPNAGDSLVLEFRNNPFDPYAWHTVWSGTASQYPATSFTKRTVFIDSSYLNDDFQFRFKNIGSRTGNINIWHVDYIVLDKGRSNQMGYFDYALSGNPTSLLSKYYSMPRKHFDASANPGAYINSIQQILLSNNDTQTVPLNFGRKVYNPEQTEIDNFPNTSPGIFGETRSAVAITSLLTDLPTAISADSLIFTSKYYTNSNNNFDNIPTNDTLSINTIFSNYFAYDDGTAESGYGIENEPGAVALGYTLETADSLQGLSMFFSQSSVDVSTQGFSLVVWSAIGTKGDGTGETAIRKVFQSRPTYKNTRNGFYYLQFNPPIYMPAGKFYIGWEQTTAFQLNMGWDENYLIAGSPAKNPDLWYKVSDGYWRRTQFNGALMIRPIVGKWIDPPVGMVEVEQYENRFEVIVYPNPASDIIYVKANTENEVNIEVMDITGRVIAVNTNKQKNIPLPNVANGVYFVKVQDLTSGDIQVKKLLINQ
jgi:hypothetical protein